MKKIISIISIVALVCIVVIFALKNNQNQTGITTPGSFDPQNASFTVENAPVTLVNGISEVHSASILDATITTRYFGNEAKGDLNGDGVDDTAFLITQDGGGSGLFYYAVVALSNPTGYKTTNAFFIGDRIAPQSTEIRSMELYVNYADRKSGEPMTAQPTVGASKVLKVTQDGELNEVQSDSKI